MSTAVDEVLIAGTVGPKLYDAVRSGTARTPGTAARVLDLDPADVDRAGAELLRLGLVRDGKRPGELAAIEPATAIGGLLARSRTALHARDQERAAGIWASVRLLDRLLPARRADVEGELTTGAANIQQALADAHERATVSRDSMSAGPVPTAIGAVRGLRADMALGQWKVRLRAIYERSGELSAQQHAYLLMLQALGAQVRLLHLVPIDLLVVDEHTVVLPVYPDRPGEALVTLRNSSWTHAATAVFEDCWDQAVPYVAQPRPTVHRTHATPLSRQRLNALRHLAATVAQDEAAQQTGCTVPAAWLEEA
ncbi:hypothetical protein QMK19_23185 [Streptomyces sp. H10-C2]|uniref:hypothetical protein n=1 Tax=unclassified Streptomyces TaxID=2593676 RepID=UPI0024B87D8C|nr:MULTISPECIES: hypothetical protein [unclassified Streptomyces]MDJ0342811.1 hypothetical protein [Streptomyces sp. PH10-H1]MDJ0372489.1 hypothetical protein [Streptomyces sp. H10-C2]